MKTSVLFFGIPRASELSLPSIFQNIVTPLSTLGRVKLSAVLYKQHSILNPRSGEHGPLNQFSYGFFHETWTTIIDPIISIPTETVAQIKKYGDAFDDQFNSLDNLLLQLQSLNLATQNAIESDDSDVYIFVRPDLIYHDKMPIGYARLVAKKPNTCILPHWQNWGGYNDRFSVCGRDSALSYGSRLTSALSFCQNFDRPLHSESLLKFALAASNTQVYLTGIRASRIRSNGLIRQENFRPYENADPFFAKLTKMISCKLEHLKTSTTSTLSNLLV